MDIKEIKNKLDRRVKGFTTQVNQFQNEDGKWVRDGLPYSIYYTRDKKEYYITDTLDPEIIVRVKGRTMFDVYKESKNGNPPSTVYAPAFRPKPTKKDKKNGYMIRYFVRQANNPFTNVIETTEGMYKQNPPFYTRVKVKWLISGDKKKVIEHNREQLEIIRETFPKSIFNFNVLEFYQEELTKKEEILKKLTI